MRHHLSDRFATLAAATTSVLAAAAHASPPRYDIVAATGRQAPGTPAGTTFGMLGYPSMNAQARSYSTPR